MNSRRGADSPQIDPAFPGETYFYLVNGGGFRAGMRVAARVIMGGPSRSGVIVPAAAVVWHAGKAWAYVKDDADSFARFEVSTAEELDGGWFNATARLSSASRPAKRAPIRTRRGKRKRTTRKRVCVPPGRTTSRVSVS